MPRTRLFMVVLALLCIPLAHANGAMGLGLEMFDLRYWFAYVVATVLVEAWLIGRYLKATPVASLVCSFVGNLITGVFCGGMGCLAVFLHFPFVGSPTEPKPFLNALVLLIVFAVPSAAVEMIVWDRVAVKKGNWKNLGWIVFVHLITIPLALVILLIPARPYRGLEAQVANARHWKIRESAKSLESYIGENGALPTATIPREILRSLKKYDNELAEDLWYEPSFGRFSMGDSIEHPFEVNPKLVGLKFKDPLPDYGEDKFVWYVRDRGDHGRTLGILVEVHTGQTQFTTDPKALGFGQP